MIERNPIERKGMGKAMKVVRFIYENEIGWGKYDAKTDCIHTSRVECSQLRTFSDVIAYLTRAEETDSYEELLPASEVRLLAPVLPTKNVLCIGKNYSEHILEFDGSDQDVERVKENPIFFSKALSSITGPNSPILRHEGVTKSLDYEAELAVVIGKRGIHIAKERALEHVYGYTILNDITARDLQKDHQQWLRGKSLDTHCPIGPWIVTTEELQDPQNLVIQSIVNGEVRQNSHTKYMMHDVASLVETLSKGMTLEPGDVIATGTPKGVGMGFTPPKFLQHGDRVEIVIEGIGTLANVVD